MTAQRKASGEGIIPSGQLWLGYEDFEAIMNRNGEDEEDEEDED